jgi:hypothetical protein
MDSLEQQPGTEQQKVFHFILPILFNLYYSILCVICIPMKNTIELWLAEFYPNDFSSLDLLRLEMQLDNYIDDMRREDSFQGINNLVDFSVKLVEINGHNIYDLVYLLLKLILILPVATTSVDRAFSTMNFVKNKLRNRMNDGF